VTTFEYLRLDLSRRAPLTDAAQIGRSISTDAGNGMAALASFRVKCYGAASACIRIRCVDKGTIGEDKDDGGKGEQGQTGPHGASERTRHLS
jgi:hypothetical protein